MPTSSAALSWLLQGVVAFVHANPPLGRRARGGLAHGRARGSLVRSRTPMGGNRPGVRRPRMHVRLGSVFGLLLVAARGAAAVPSAPPTVTSTPAEIRTQLGNRGPVSIRFEGAEPGAQLAGGGRVGGDRRRLRAARRTGRGRCTMGRARRAPLARVARSVLRRAVHRGRDRALPGASPGGGARHDGVSQARTSTSLVTSGGV